jgi:hypothetical protein
MRDTAVSSVARDSRVWAGARLDRLGQLRQLRVDPFDPVARRIQPALLALQLPGEFRDAAVRQVQRALDVLALLFGGQCLVAQRTDLRVEFALALRQRFDPRAQRLDLLLAQQRALLGRARAQHPHPAGTQALAVAGDDRFARAQPRQHRARIGEGFGGVQPGQQPADRGRPAHFRGQRRRRAGHVVLIRGHQGQPAFSQFAQRVDQRLGRLDQDALDQLPERGFDRVLPARFHLQLPAHARGRIQPAPAQPFHRRTLLLPERGVLQRFQRRQPAAHVLAVLADLGQLALRLALSLLQVGHRLLAGLDLGGEAV